MREGSIINVGRGNCVDEEAMIAHLQSGHLGGAGLDVFAVEPLPEESPLWSMPGHRVSGFFGYNRSLDSSDRRRAH